MVFINDISKSEYFRTNNMVKLKEDNNENNFDYYDSCYNYLFNIPEEHRLDISYLTITKVLNYCSNIQIIKSEILRNHRKNLQKYI